MIKDKFSRYFELEELTNAQLSFRDHLHTFEITNVDDIEKAANSLREVWNLGTKPIPNFIEMLEENGIKVLEVDASNSFQGFYAEANGELVVVINSNDDAFRKRFTALHELGHITLKIKEGLDIEKCCHRFAGAFLFPKQSVIETFSAKRKKLSFSELIQQKCYYGISIQALLVRLLNLDIISEATYKGFLIWMTKSGYRTNEPGQYAGVEKALWFSQLLYRAAIEEVISLSKAASLSNQSLSEFRKTLVGGNIEKSMSLDTQQVSNHQALISVAVNDANLLIDLWEINLMAHFFQVHGILWVFEQMIENQILSPVLAVEHLQNLMKINA